MCFKTQVAHAKQWISCLVHYQSPPQIYKSHQGPTLPLYVTTCHNLQSILNNTLPRRQTNIWSIQVLEQRPLRPRNPLNIPMEILLSFLILGELIIAPLPFKIQIIDWGSFQGWSKNLLLRLKRVVICRERRIPELAFLGSVIDYVGRDDAI